MRDHYYQLWDLEKNFGEKIMCDGTGPNKSNYGLLAQSLQIGRATWNGVKVAEKPSNPDGIAVGVEVSPKEMWLNDCCVLNHDEDKWKTKTLWWEEAMNIDETVHRFRSTDPCSEITITRDDGVTTTTAGTCQFFPKTEKLFPSDYDKFHRIAQVEQKKFMKWYGRKFGYTLDYLKIPTRESYKGGFACSGMLVHAMPDKEGHKNQNFKMLDGDKFRHITRLDRLCNPDLVKMDYEIPPPPPFNPCASVKIRKEGQEIITGGKCVKKAALGKKFGEDWTAFKKFHFREVAKGKKKFGKFGFTEHTHYRLPAEETYESGFVCDKIKPSVPMATNFRRVKIFDVNYPGNWRDTTKLDMVCSTKKDHMSTIPLDPNATPPPTQATLATTKKPRPQTTRPPTTSTVPDGRFTVGCKVPDHNGPLGEGFEANSAWSASFNEERRTDPNVSNGELDPEDFGEWWNFANCLKSAMLLIEGQAYFKETENSKDINTNKHPVLDNGSSSGKELFDDIVLAGAKIGQSKLAQGRAQALFDQMKDENDTRTFHGAGTRYNEKSDGSDSIVLECTKHLPAWARDDPKMQPYAIQPNFDLDNDLLGYYVSNDQTGGNLKELLVKSVSDSGDIEYDLTDRPIQKYYQENDGKYLTGFTPEY